MDNEKFQRIIEFFEQEQEVEIPIEVKNSIEDVFNETDELGDADIYFREDHEVLQEDLTLTNRVDVYLGKPSIGSSNNVYTHSGEIDYSLSEFVTLYDENGNLEEEITRIDNTSIPTIVDPNTWAVVLIEKVEWAGDKLDRILKFYIYCPELSLEERESDNG